MFVKTIATLISLYNLDTRYLDIFLLIGLYFIRYEIILSKALICALLASSTWNKYLPIKILLIHVVNILICSSKDEFNISHCLIRFIKNAQVDWYWNWLLMLTTCRCWRKSFSFTQLQNSPEKKANSFLYCRIIRKRENPSSLFFFFHQCSS